RPAAAHSAAQPAASLNTPAQKSKPLSHSSHPSRPAMAEQSTGPAGTLPVVAVPWSTALVVAPEGLPATALLAPPTPTELLVLPTAAGCCAVDPPPDVVTVP